METSKVLEINAALWKLTEGEDIVDSAKIIIEYATTLPASKRFNFEGKVRSYDSETYSGQTELGNVTYQEEKEKIKQFSYGEHKERIGHFRLWREANLIIFHHFWASTMETSGSFDPELKEYGIIYNDEDNALEIFGSINKFSKNIFNMFGIKIFVDHRLLFPSFPKEDKKVRKIGKGFSITFG